MAGDSSTEGRGFKSQHRILDVYFFTLIGCKIVLMFVYKRPKINEKAAGDGEFLLSGGSHHSSVDLSAPSILPPQV